MRAFALVLCAGLAALGCQKSEPPAPLASSATAAATSGAPSAAPAPAAAPAVDSAVPLNPGSAAMPVTAAALPTQADYEVKAQSAITPANAAQVLGAIEKEIGK